MSTKVLDDPAVARYSSRPMIDVRNANFRFGDTAVLHDLSLHIHPGESVAIMGANGSGKTTLARCLNGLLVPQSGTVCVDGMCTNDPEHISSVRRAVAMVFQNPDDQLIATTVESELAFGLENLEVPPDEIRARIEQALDDFHLRTYRKNPPHRLSGGEKQRIAIAAATIMRPRYLVLDEPTALLDPQHRLQIIDALNVLRAHYDMATVLVTHMPDEALSADRILALQSGRILFDDAPDTVFSDPDRLQKAGLDSPFARRLSVQVGLSTTALTPDQFVAAWEQPVLPLQPAADVTSLNRVNHRPVIEARSIHHAYENGANQPLPSLSDVSAQFSAGTIHALLGTSGSGKSTLAQHLNGLLSPNAGHILLDGADINSRPLIETRRRVGLVFQFPELQLFAERVDEDVSFGPRNMGYTEKDISALVEQALAWVALPVEEFGHRAPLSLSGGEKRRVAIAGVLAMDPDVLVLDEPTAGLDAPSTSSLCAVIRQLAQRDKAIVLITHDMDLTAQLADNTTILSAGKVVLQGTARSVLAREDFGEQTGLLPPTAVQIAVALRRRGARITQLPLTLEELVRILHNPSEPRV